MCERQNDQINNKCSDEKAQADISSQSDVRLRTSYLHNGSVLSIGKIQEQSPE